MDGVCMLLPRALLNSVGGFDERYGFHGYDKDLSLAVRERGRRCHVVHAPFRHHGGGTRAREFATRRDVAQRDLADRRAANARFAANFRHRLPCDVRPVGERLRNWVSAKVTGEIPRGVIGAHQDPPDAGGQDPGAPAGPAARPRPERRFAPPPRLPLASSTLPESARGRSLPGRSEDGAPRTRTAISRRSDMGRFLWPLALVVTFILGLAAGSAIRQGPSATQQKTVERLQQQISTLQARRHTWENPEQPGAAAPGRGPGSPTPVRGRPIASRPRPSRKIPRLRIVPRGEVARSRAGSRPTVRRPNRALPPPPEQRPAWRRRSTASISLSRR